VVRRIGILFGFLSLLALIAKPIWHGHEQWQWGQGQDGGIYWITAKSLAMGAGYRAASLPDKPYAMKYPPLYPLFLSIALRIQPAFPQSLHVAAALQTALLAIYVLVMLLLLRQFGLSWRRTFLLAAMSIAIWPGVKCCCSRSSWGAGFCSARLS
jgi:hypothetical protein